jgi:hypothetical protein
MRQLSGYSDGLDGRGSLSGRGMDISLFTECIYAVGFTQPHIQWVPVVISTWGKRPEREAGQKLGELYNFRKGLHDVAFNSSSTGIILRYVIDYSLPNFVMPYTKLRLPYVVYWRCGRGSSHEKLIHNTDCKCHYHLVNFNFWNSWMLRYITEHKWTSFLTLCRLKSVLLLA